MQIFHLFLIFIVIFLSSRGCGAKELEVECDVSQDHNPTTSCSVIAIVCNVNSIHVPIDNKTKFLFTNADSENFTSVEFDGIKLHRFPSEIFDQFPQLTHLDARGGEWNDFPLNAFEHASQLMELNVRRNKIKKLDTFVGAINLLSLHLSRNLLEELPLTAFENLPKLEYLDLERNEIESVEGATFWPLKNLKTLNLNHNNLKKIDHMAFHENQKLVFLDLEGLKMENLELLFGEMHLLRLSLEDSSIESLRIRYFFLQKM